MARDELKKCQALEFIPHNSIALASSRQALTRCVAQYGHGQPPRGRRVCNTASRDRKRERRCFGGRKTPRHAGSASHGGWPRAASDSEHRNQHLPRSCSRYGEPRSQRGHRYVQGQERRRLQLSVFCLEASATNPPLRDFFAAATSSSNIEIQLQDCCCGLARKESANRSPFCKISGVRHASCWLC